MKPLSAFSEVVDERRRWNADWYSWLSEFAQSLERPGVTFSKLPSPPVRGMETIITDSNTNVWGAIIAGGGANVVLAWYNGVNWTVIGK